MIDLIYCAGGNPRLSQIADEEGWLIGFRSDYVAPTHPICFIDIDYKHPDFMAHLRTVTKHKPKYAIVPDLSDKMIDQQDIDRAIKQAELLTGYCEIPLIVPKLSGQLDLIPERFAIGYSVPSRYGGADYLLWELAGRRIHLLGGSPKKQFQAYLHLSAIAEVISADGNYAQRQATKFAEYWTGKKWVEHPDYQAEEAARRKDLYFECWRWSCQNIMKGWRKLCQ